jgi:uncharacterized hydrophobic protein (TIGR00271 family)
MGLLGKAITAGAGHRKTLETLSDELFPGVGDVRAKQWKFWMLLVLSSVIAAGGVIGDSTPAVIGAMIVAPLAIPIYGVALAAVVGSARGMRDAFGLLMTGILVNIGIGVLAGLVFFDRIPINENPQIIGRTAPTVLDLVVAVATGLAGSFAFVRRDVSDVLAGVAIAISLVPVLAVVGITLGSGEFDLALGALVLFLTNVAAILVSGALVFTAAGYDREAIQASPVIRRRARVFIVALVIALIVPLTYSSVRTFQREVWVGRVQEAAQEWVDGTDWNVTGAQYVGGTIVLNVIGYGDPPPADKLREYVRRSVPERIPVRVVEDYGSDEEL